MMRLVCGGRAEPFSGTEEKATRVKTMTKNSIKEES
jgi:hypothetical protein